MTKRSNKYWLLALVLMPLFNFSQTTGAQSESYLSNPLFITLLIVMLGLVFVIIGMAHALKNIAGSDFFVEKLKKNMEDKGGPGKITSVIILLLLGHQLSAANQGKTDWLIGGLDMITFFFMLSVICVELIVIGVMYSTFMRLLSTDKKPEAVKPKTKTILERINASVDVEEEKDILLDHDYDGIKELDNDLPPWWKYGFYVTIIFAVIYLLNFHVAGTGDLQKTEYEKSIAQAKRDVEEYMKTAANNVDETTVKMLGAEEIEAGKQVFIANCAACHGNDGRGTVGPNLTDEYWLHGGSIVDIFKTIKYGWVDKGMKSWKEDLSPMQIAQIASFIRTLKGTNPANAKAAQGDMYKEEGPAPGDTTKVLTDSLVVKKDTLN